MAFVSTFFGLLEQAGIAHKKLLDEAFEKGREAGRAEAVAEFKARLAGLTDSLAFEGNAATHSDQNEEQKPSQVRPESQASDQHVAKRASPGSVKPTIAKLVADRPGLTTRELEQITGFKLNSIRGTLWTLQNEKVIERRGEQVFPLAQKDEAAGTNPEERMPTASITGAYSASDQPQTHGQQP